MAPSISSIAPIKEIPFFAIIFKHALSTCTKMRRSPLFRSVCLNHYITGLGGIAIVL